MPTTVHLPGGAREQMATSTSAETHLAPRRLTFTTDELAPMEARSERVASRLCSFICQLDRHLAWREGRHVDLPFEDWPRTLAGKRKHIDEDLPPVQPPPHMGYLQRQQITYLSIMIRNYTNDGEGSPSFRTFDANEACTLTWQYLVRRFSQTELSTILLRTLEQAKVLLRSEFTLAHQRNLLQEHPQATEENWQGNAEEIAWVRSMIKEAVISRGELMELFEEALLKQINSAFQASARLPNPEDHSQDFQNSMALRFYQIINPLYDDVYEEYKPYAIVYKMLASFHRKQVQSLLRAREAAILASPYRTINLVPVCE